MASRSHAQKKPSSDLSLAPQTCLQTRPFAPQAEAAPAQTRTMHDLQNMLEMAQRSGHHWANITASSHPSSSFAIQPKLTIGAPRDKYEREADRVAHQVVQQLNAPKLERAAPEQSIRRKSLSEEEDELQMKPMAVKSSNGLTDASADLEGAIAQVRGRGQPLADRIRQPMEKAFGADFSGVKLHTDSRADQFNRAIQARAFTTGQDVFFRQGAYQPGSRGGQELIAHELTHVVQQNNTAINRKLGGENERERLGIAETSFLQKTVIQRVLLSDETDLDPYILKGDIYGLEDLYNKYFDNQNDDPEKIENAMNLLKGNIPSSLKYQGTVDKDDEYDLHEWSLILPKNQHQDATVNGKWYRFWNDAQSCLDFEQPKNNGMQIATPLAIVKDVQINDGIYVKHTNQKQLLKQKKGYNYWHFWAANKEAKFNMGGVSPPGYTWHHHKDSGGASHLGTSRNTQSI